MASFFALRRAPVAIALTTATLVCACGARGPLDIIVVEEAPLDASTDATRGVEAGAEASVDGSADAADAADAAPDAQDAAPDSMTGFDGGAIFNCGSCVVQTCGTQVLSCVTSSTCTTALQCVVTTCLTGGTPNFGCIGTCTNGDSTTQSQVLGLVGCIIGNCGMSCTGALGGLGGLGGGGGSSGGSSGGGGG